MEMKWFEVLSLLLRVAFRNIWLYRVRTIIIAGLLGVGAFLAVVGLSLLRDVEASMRASITESIAGDLQVYSNKAKDDLAIFGSSFMGRADIGTLPDLVPVRDEAMRHANVEAIVPMGQDMAMLGRGNEMDDALDALRAALKSGDNVIINDRIDQLKFQLQQLKLEIAEKTKLYADRKELDEQLLDIAKVEAPGFLEELKTLDETKLQFLETKIAPLSGEKQPIYLNYVGTDISLFQKNFSKFKVVSGESLPVGRRGILVSQKVREDFLKNLVARLFDRINKRKNKAGIAIAGDPENQRNAADLPRQYSQVVSYLDRAAAAELSKQLTAYGIAGDEGTIDLIAHLTGQLKSFLAVDDKTFDDRYKWFYAHIAPHIKLYEISPGETITLNSYTRSGYVKSLPLKVYGVYTFSGLEDSDLAGAMNIIDLVSFRELYGQMTESAKKELDEMRAQIGVKDISAENAEDALFGESSQAPIEKKVESVDASNGVSATIQVKPVIADSFDQSEIQKGLAINAAIKLKNPELMDETLKDLDAAFKEKGFDLRVVNWQAASGIVGQFVNIVRMALIFSLGVIFIVALVIINNSIVVSTLNRIREIGTMRAIGAQRSFVVGLFLAETGITGLLGALVGTALAALALGILASKGIPAANDVVSFLFSGPRLYPTLRWSLVVSTPVVVTFIATLASIYAARHAAQVKPAEAMQEKE